MGGLGRLVQEGPHMQAHWNAVATAEFAVKNYWENRRYRDVPGYPKKTVHEYCGDMDVHFW